MKHHPTRVTLRRTATAVYVLRIDRRAYAETWLLTKPQLLAFLTKYQIQRSTINAQHTTTPPLL